MPQMAELYLRHNYAKQHRLAEDKRQLEERTEQLLCEKERLLYDVQRRGHPLDDEDDRSAIRRGLQAGLSRPYHPADDTDPSEPGGPAPSGSPPPSLPPGAPPSTAGDSTAATWEDANWLTEEGLVLARSSQGLAGFEGVYASGAGFGADLQKGAKRAKTASAARVKLHWNGHGGPRVSWRARGKPLRQRLRQAPGKSSWRRRHSWRRWYWSKG